MTATQVFIRFLKEIGYYSKIKPYIIEAAMKRGVYDEDYEILKNKYGDSQLIVDRLLKNCRYSLSNLSYALIYSRGFATSGCFRFIDKKWRAYLRKNINGNYFKVMIPDNELEIAFHNDIWGRAKYRNGYHSLDFTLKDNIK